MVISFMETDKMPESKLDRLGEQLLILSKELGEDVGLDKRRVQGYFAGFLEAAYALDEQLKKSFGKESVTKCKDGMRSDDRVLIQSLLGKRGRDTHGGGLEIEEELESRPAEHVRGMSVVGPLLPVTDAEAEPARQVGMKPGQLAAIKIPKYFIRYRNGRIVLREACQRCVRMFEQILSELLA
jgi:hypothetical protein